MIKYVSKEVAHAIFNQTFMFNQAHILEISLLLLKLTICLANTSHFPRLPEKSPFWATGGDTALLERTVCLYESSV